MSNAGKVFEQEFKNSVEDDGFYYCRLNDPAQSFHVDNNLRFSPKNPYDCFLFCYPNLMTLELKSTIGTSITFYREDFEAEGKHTYMIKKHQIDGLLKSSKYNGVISGFILNFRKTNHTYFLSIDDFILMTKTLNKKSFNENDVVSNSGYFVEQSLKRVKYKYYIKNFIEMLQENIIKSEVI